MVNWILAIGELDLLIQNTTEAFATFEIDPCLVPPLQKLFSNASKWPALPLTTNEIDTSEAGLFRWLLVSFSGARPWNKFARMVLNKIVLPVLTALEEGRFTGGQIPKAFTYTIDWLHYYWGMIQEDQLFARIGGPLLSTEQNQDKRNDVQRRVHGVSIFAKESEKNLVIKPNELLTWVWKALWGVEEALKMNESDLAANASTPRASDTLKSLLKARLAGNQQRPPNGSPDSVEVSATPRSSGPSQATIPGQWPESPTDPALNNCIGSIISGMGDMAKNKNFVKVPAPQGTRVHQNKPRQANAHNHTRRYVSPGVSISRDKIQQEVSKRLPEMKSQNQGLEAGRAADTSGQESTAIPIQVHGRPSEKPPGTPAEQEAYLEQKNEGIMTERSAIDAEINKLMVDKRTDQKVIGERIVDLNSIGERLVEEFESNNAEIARLGRVVGSKPATQTLPTKNMPASVPQGADRKAQLERQWQLERQAREARKTKQQEDARQAELKRQREIEHARKVYVEAKKVAEAQRQRDLSEAKRKMEEAERQAQMQRQLEQERERREKEESDRVALLQQQIADQQHAEVRAERARMATEMKPKLDESKRRRSKSRERIESPAPPPLPPKQALEAGLRNDQAFSTAQHPSAVITPDHLLPPIEISAVLPSALKKDGDGKVRRKKSVNFSPSTKGE
ncbi:hypothetical protein B0J14DRAFT_140181 [Halenospora varia]|nr:hypothetical protein B0J14DRAFT_140181 [Halenospora varia]